MRGETHRREPAIVEVDSRTGGKYSNVRVHGGQYQDAVQCHEFNLEAATPNHGTSPP